MPAAASRIALPDRYRGVRRAANGGMAGVWAAEDGILRRLVAVKVLSAAYAEDPAARRRFSREARACAKLGDHPNVVTVYDVGEHDGLPFMVMEFFAGGSVADRLREQQPIPRPTPAPPGRREPQPTPRPTAIRWLREAASALDHAHRHGVVHRDVKPANLLLDRNGNVHVADFGIASAAGMDSLTMTGTVLGTAGYLSPEQAQGQQATAASDRYSLAVVAFELLSGRRPFENDSITAEAAAHVHAAVPSIAEICEGLPDELDPVFRRALAKDPSQRFETASEFVAALRAALSDAAGATRTLPPVVAEPAPAPPRRRAQPAGSGSSRGWLVLGALLALGAIAGAPGGALLRGGANDKPAAAAPRERTVTTVITRQGTTVQTTVQTTAAKPPPSPPPTPPPPSSLSGSALNDAGYSKQQAGDYAAALPLLQQAVAKLRGVGFPTEAYAHYNLGYTLLQLGRCS